MAPAQASLQLSASTFTTATGPTHTQLADLNGDGKPELIVANWGSGINSLNRSFSVVNGNGNGTFGSRNQWDAGAGSAPRATATADLNGDGKTDVVTANYGTYNVGVFLNTTPSGSGTAYFSSGTSPALSDSPFAIATGDLNADGNADVVASTTGGSVKVLLGNGDGTFQPATSYYAGAYSAALVLADLNGDGKLDVATANENANTVSVLTGTGSGTLNAATNYSEGTSASPAGIAAGDLDGDGDPDLVIADAGTNKVSVRLNSAGSFATSTTYTTGALPVSVSIRDINGDSKLDVVTADQSAKGGSIFLGDGQGGLGARTAYAAGATTAFVTTGDVNADGRADIVTANEGDNTATLLLGTNTSCVLGTGSASTFSFTGAEQCYVVPAGVTSLNVTATGGGGRTSTSNVGAVATGTISVTPGQTLYVEVGGTGFSSSWNGGGTFSGGLSSGGGASDVRSCSNAFCALTGSALSDPRLIVAGGAGGVGQTNSGGSYGGSGGNGGGGGLTPGAGLSSTATIGVASTGGGGATSSTGGAAGTGADAGGATGSVGAGASACREYCNGGSGGGGGGGWFGGGSGGSGNGGAGGGAGSNYGPALTTFSSASVSYGSVVLTPVLPAPTVSSAAAVSGQTVKGMELTGAATFTNATTTSYLWQRCDSAGTNCTGSLATTATYTPVSADVGAKLRFTATGTNSGGSVTSAATTAVIAASRTTLYGAAATAADTNGLYDGTWSGTAAYTGDRNGTASSAFSFSGSTSISADAQAGTFAANDATIAFWVKTSATAKTALLTTRNGCTNTGWDIRLNRPGLANTVSIEAFTANGAVVGATTAVNDGAWHLVTVSRSGTVLSLGVDGVRQGSADVASSGLNAGAPLTMAAGGCTGADGTTKLVGAMDEVKLVNGVAAPLVATAASMTGPEQQGATLTATAAFSGTSPSTSYRWQRCDAAGTGCADIAGATSAAYTAVSGDVGHVLKAVVTGGNDAGSASSTATTTSTVVPLAPTVTTAAAIAGPPVLGGALTATAGFDNGTVTFRWQRCDTAGANCAGTLATTAGYTPVSADVGATLRVTATATNSGGATSTSATSAVIDATRTVSWTGDGTATDAHGFYDGTWSGTPAYTADQAGVPGAAFSFTGDTSISASADAGAFAGNDFTVSLKVRTTQSGWAELLGTRSGCGFTGWEVRSIGGNPWLELWNGGVHVALTNTTGGVINDGAWHTLTFARLGSTLRGSLDGDVYATATLGADLDTGGPVEIGGEDCSNQDGTLPLTGAIDAVSLSNGIAAPMTTTAASVSGTELEGQALTASATFAGTSVAGDTRWLRCDSVGAGCTAIPGATAASYTATASDVGSRLKAVVTGGNDAGSATTSALTGVIASANTAPSAGGDRAAPGSAATGSPFTVDVAPTRDDAQSLPVKARVVSIPANASLRRTDGTAIAAGDDVALDGGRLRLAVTAGTPADIAIGYRMVDASDDSLVSPASVISVDVAPVVSFDGGPADGSSSSAASPAFAFSGAGAGGSYTCGTDGAAAAACSSPTTLSNLRWGPHRIAVTATDADGDTATRTVAWTVTGSLGAPAIIAGPPAETGERSATLQVQGDPGAVPQCSLDGAAYTWCASSVTYDNLALGPHVFTVRQVDAAGNVSDAATRRWRIDVSFKPGDDGTNIKSVKGLVNQEVAPADNLVGVGCQLNRGSLHRCDVDAYAEVESSRKARKASLQVIGTGSVTLSDRGQSSAVVDVKLNATGQKLVKAHPEGVPVTLKVTAQPFDSDAELRTTSASRLRPPQMLIVPSRGMFAGDSYDLGSAGLQYVAAVAKLLDGARRVRCEGYSDGDASPGRAKAMSYLRAKAVCDALDAAGVSGKIGATGMGSGNARGDNTTAAGRRRNRRVEIRVWF